MDNVKYLRKVIWTIVSVFGVATLTIAAFGYSANVEDFVGKSESSKPVTNFCLDVWYELRFDRVEVDDQYLPPIDRKHKS